MMTGTDTAPQRTDPYSDERCFDFLFPFVGTRLTVRPEMTGEYWESQRKIVKPCKPIFLARGGFDFFSPVVRLAATAAIVWLLLRKGK
jgi:hypothetical protein